MTWLLALLVWGDPVEGARAAVMEHVRTLPDYVCREETRRYLAERTQSRKQYVDQFEAEVAFTRQGQIVRGLKRNGEIIEDPRRLTDAGMWTTGEFGNLLRNLFDPELAVEFKAKSGGRSLDFTVSREASRWEIWLGKEKILLPFAGTIWLDPESGLPKRLFKRTRAVPIWVGVDLLETEVEYGWVTLGDRKAWLPLRSRSLTCRLRQQTCFYNVSEFKNYRKFGAESRLVP